MLASVLLLLSEATNAQAERETKEEDRALMSLAAS